jgi:hypothetical protein
MRECWKSALLEFPRSRHNISGRSRRRGRHTSRQLHGPPTEDDQHDHDTKHPAKPLQRSARIDTMVCRSAPLPTVYPRGEKEYDLSLANPERNVGGIHAFRVNDIEKASEFVDAIHIYQPILDPVLKTSGENIRVTMPTVSLFLRKEVVAIHKLEGGGAVCIHTMKEHSIVATAIHSKDSPRQTIKDVILNFPNGITCSGHHFGNSVAEAKSQSENEKGRSEESEKETNELTNSQRKRMKRKQNRDETVQTPEKSLRKFHSMPQQTTTHGVHHE